MRKTASLIILIVWTVSFAGAQQSAFDPLTLVRESIDLEIKAAQDYSIPYRYILRKESNSGVAVRQMIETREGLVLARTITWNGKPNSPESQAKEDGKLEQLARNPDERGRKLKAQQDDAQRVLRILRALPTSSLYTYDGREQVNGRDTIRLTFKPNPRFSPEGKETYLLKAATGKMWIDAASKRLARIDGAITDSVNIGWGLLGHIDKGGKLFLQQEVVKGGEWRLTQMRIDATGKALIFKSIRIRQYQNGTDFEPIKPVTVAEAVAELKRLGETASASR
jgi:hypothetical protein